MDSVTETLTKNLTKRNILINKDLFRAICGYEAQK